SARERTVTSLVAEVASAARGTRLELIDPAGATKGYATGRPTGGPAVASSWQHGVDVEAVAAVCDGVEVIGYAADPERLRLDVDAAAGVRAPALARDLSARPGSSSVLLPPSTVKRPFTRTYGIPSGSCRGSS